MIFARADFVNVHGAHSGSGRFLQLHAGKTGEKFRSILPTPPRHRSAFGKVSQAILSGRLALFLRFIYSAGKTLQVGKAATAQRFDPLNFSQAAAGTKSNPRLLKAVVCFACVRSVRGRAKNYGD